MVVAAASDYNSVVAQGFTRSCAIALAVIAFAASATPCHAAEPAANADGREAGSAKTVEPVYGRVVREDMIRHPGASLPMAIFLPPGIAQFYIAPAMPKVAIRGAIYFAATVVGFGLAYSVLLDDDWLDSGSEGPLFASVFLLYGARAATIVDAAVVTARLNRRRIAPGRINPRFRDQYLQQPRLRVQPTYFRSHDAPTAGIRLALDF